MRVGILGVDARGVQLAQMLLRAGHVVTLSDPVDAERAQRAANGVAGASAVALADQVRLSDILVFMIRSQEIDRAIDALGRVDGPVIVETSRPAADGSMPSVAEQLVQRLGTSRIVKTLTQALEPGEAVLVAGDDADAKRIVSEVIASIGMRPVDAGMLLQARRMESATATADPIMQ